MATPPVAKRAPEPAGGGHGGEGRAVLRAAQHRRRPRRPLALAPALALAAALATLVRVGRQWVIDR
jgi:hypothetical protein